MSDHGGLAESRDASEHPSDGGSLNELRDEIDRVDAELIALLNRRADVVVRIGDLKRGDGTPIYAPHREQAVLAKVLERNHGPLPDRTVEAIYRELMSGSFSLELPLRVAYLGPPGSFSHMAAVRHFGSSVEHSDLRNIDQVFKEVAGGHAAYGLVPYENSTMGSITDTLDAFQQFDVVVYAEALIEINHHRLANCERDEINAIHSKPQIFDQCRDWLHSHYPNAELVASPSSASAVRLAANEGGVAAIGSVFAGELYGVRSLYEHIEDHPNNITRFLIIGLEETEQTGDDKTSIMFTTAHKPGALVDVLNVFRDREINLSHIEKRPSRHTNWEYTFFIDCDAHRTEPAMAEAIADAKHHCQSMKGLGSYPRTTRIL